MAEEWPARPGGVRSMGFLVLSFELGLTGLAFPCC